MKKEHKSTSNTSENDLMLNYYNTIVQTKSYEIKYDWTMPFKKNSSTSSSGSGFFIDDKGHILTCAHCVEDANKCYVIIPNEGRKEYEAVIKGVCPFFDIALIQIQNYKNKHYCELEEDDSAVVSGVETYALGFPLGQDNLKITRGIISGQQLNYYQTDTSINPGNSGGPLILNNKVIGINGAGINGAENVGYAIPINRFFLIKKQLFSKRHNLINYPQIFGINYQKTTDDFKQYIGNTCKDGGIMIKEVFKGSPIASTRLKKGDILCSINGIQIDEYGYLNERWMNQKMDLQNLMATLKLNQSVSISYWNGKKMKKNNFLLKEFKQPIRKMYPNFESIDYEVIGGMVFMNLTINHLYNFKLRNNDNDKYTKIENRGKPKIILVNVLLGSDIAKNKLLNEGDIITKINNKSVSTLKDLRTAFPKVLYKKRTGSYVKIQTEKSTVALVSVETLLKEEPHLIETFMYRESKLLKKIKKIK